MGHSLIFGHDEPLALWACDKIPWAEYHPGMRAVGVADSGESDADLLAVCIYHSFTPGKFIDGRTWYSTCEISLAAASPRWATRRTITNLLRIPFRQYGCRKVLTITPSINKRAIDFNAGIGFKREGVLRHQYAKNVHAYVHGMLRDEFEKRWPSPPSLNS